MSDHLDFIHIYGLNGGENECFQGLIGGGDSEETISGGTVSTSVTLDVTPLVEALAPLQDLASLTPEPVDLTPIIEALAPLSHLERITELDLTDLLTRLEDIRDKIPTIVLTTIEQRLEELRDHLAALAFVDAKIDFGFFKIWLLNRIVQM